MATTIWEGGAPEIAQVDTVQITGYDAATTYTLTINGKTVSVTGVTDEDGTAAALQAAWNASTIPEATEITATVATDTVTLTAATAGVPHTVASSVAGGGGTIGAVTASVANSGPNCFNIGTNWSEDEIPGTSQKDAMVFENSDVDCLYGLSSMGANDISTLTIKASFTGYLGLPRDNAGGYREYRPQYLLVGDTTADTSQIDVGQGDGDGSGRIKIATGNLDAALAINVYKTGTPIETGIPALLITTGTQSNDTTVIVNRGDVGVAFYAGETAVIDTFTVGYISNVTSDASVVCGSGVTLTTITKNGGDVSIESNVTTVTQTAGTFTIGGTATCATLYIDGGVAYYESSGTLTQTVYVSGRLDFRRDGRSRQIDGCKMYKGGSIYDPQQTVGWTGDIELQRCGIEDVTLELGKGITVAT